MGTGVRAPQTVNGNRPPAAQSKRAPICDSGSVTRAIGRRRRETSPVITARRSWVARMPSNSRAAVPALRRSRTVSGSASPPMPTPSIVQAPSGCRTTVTPRWPRARAVASTSSPSSRPVTRVRPTARAPSIRARCEIDLSPGTAGAPSSRSARRAMAGRAILSDISGRAADISKRKDALDERFGGRRERPDRCGRAIRALTADASLPHSRLMRI